MNHVPQKVTPPRDLKECIVCERRFTIDRINAHEAICQKTSNIVRKRFDSSQQRVAGTDVEILAKTTAKDDCAAKLPKTSLCALSTNWRWKHEELIKKVNEAKGKGETKIKANDLPYPPPVDNDADYVQCPHCLRPFNQLSASRHMTACAAKMCKSNSKTNVSELKISSSQPTTE